MNDNLPADFVAAVADDLTRRLGRAAGKIAAIIVTWPQIADDPIAFDAMLDQVFADLCLDGIDPGTKAVALRAAHDLVVAEFAIPAGETIQ